MSKELQALEEIKDIHYIVMTKVGYTKEDVLKKSKAINIIETALKALEIITKKECLFKGLSELTQEEFDLLKEVLL